MSDEHQQPPTAAPETNVVKIYIRDEESGDEHVVGKILIDEKRDAWLQIDKDSMAEHTSVENIDGIAMLDKTTFNSTSID